MLRETSLARGVEAGLRNLEVLPRLLVVRVRHVRIQQDLQLIQEGQPILEHRRQIGCRGHRAADRRSSAWGEGGVVGEDLGSVQYHECMRRPFLLYGVIGGQIDVRANFLNYRIKRTLKTGCCLLVFGEIF